VNVQVFVLLPPLEQAPDQITSRSVVARGVIDVPTLKDAEPLLPTRTLIPAGVDVTRSPLRPVAFNVSVAVCGAGVSVSVVDRVTSPALAVIVTAVDVVTALVAIANVALVPPPVRGRTGRPPRDANTRRPAAGEGSLMNAIQKRTTADPATRFSSERLDAVFVVLGGKSRRQAWHLAAAPWPARSRRPTSCGRVGSAASRLASHASGDASHAVGTRRPLPASSSFCCRRSDAWDDGQRLRNTAA